MIKVSDLKRLGVEVVAGDFAFSNEFGTGDSLDADACITVNKTTANNELFITKFAWRENAGKMPARPDAVVEIELRDGTIFTAKSVDLRWLKDGRDSDIISWKPCMKSLLAKLGSGELELTEAPLGMKHDQDKPRYDLLPAVAIDELAKVLTFGAKKYAPNSWQAVENGLERYRAALLRHTFAIQRGELIDEESGLQHSAHAMTCAAFIVELEKQLEQE